MWQKIKEWFQANTEHLFLFVGVVLVGVLCFEAGLLQGKIGEKTPLSISIPPVPEESVIPALSIQSEGSVPMSSVQPVAAQVEKTNCAFVGSKNSNKYHLPICTVAKRIKLENRVCFASKEEAEKRGYVPSCLK